MAEAKEEGGRQARLLLNATLCVKIHMNVFHIKSFLLRALFSCFMLVALLSCTRNETPHNFSRALIGHWETINGQAQYYVSVDEVTSYVAKEDRLATYKYIVLQQYPAQRTIEIRVQIQGSNDFKVVNDRKLVFSSDYKIAEVYLRADLSELLKRDDPKKLEYMQTNSWRYVDSKQKP